MSVEEKAHAVIDQLESPENYAIEFWKSGTKEDFREAAEILIDHGFDVEYAADFLARLYSSVGQEYS